MAGDGGRVGEVGGGAAVDVEIGRLDVVGRREGDSGDAALDGGVGGADGAREGVVVRAGVGACGRVSWEGGLRGERSFTRSWVLRGRGRVR